MISEKPRINALEKVTQVYISLQPAYQFEEETL